jgi:hypothetical protein
MTPVTELRPYSPFRPAEDQRALAQDAFHRLAHWLAEVSAEAASDRATTAVDSTGKRSALDHVGVPSR